jgi:hypothetical protein
MSSVADDGKRGKVANSCHTFVPLRYILYGCLGGATSKHGCIDQANSVCGPCVNAYVPRRAVGQICLLAS